VQSDVGVLRSMVLKHARDAFVNQASIDEQWRDLGYLERPDLERALAEYDAFAALLQRSGVEVHFLPRDERTGMDSVYARDSTVVSDRGVILCRMGKQQRRGEPAAVADALRSMGIKVHGSIEGEGLLEGGDVVWLAPDTLVVGRGYRTNDEGIRQLRELLGDTIRELLVAPLPHWRGPGDVFHLMSLLSPLDLDLALVYSPLLPVPLREALLRRGIELVEVAEEEFEMMAGNVLALAPRRCVMMQGNPITKGPLEDAGVEVETYAGGEISAKGCGGPTCLTRPLLRDAV
ncbi:MAG: arginine deiminase family protein, partial [Planctomycetota bacterium]